MTSHLSIVGFQLGLTNCSAAVFHKDKFCHIPISPNQLVLPAMVFMENINRVLVGSEARRKKLEKPKYTYYELFRLLGEKYSHSTMEKLTQYFPFSINGSNEMTPKNFLEKILGKLKEVTQDYLENEIKNVRLAVPNFFGLKQNQIIQEVCSDLQLEVDSIISQPICAIYYYLLQNPKKGLVPVIDWGGQSIEISIFELFEDEIHFLGSTGELFMGEYGFIENGYEKAIQKLKSEKKVTLEHRPISQQRLLDALEAAKCQLSKISQAQIHLPFLTQGMEGSPIDFDWLWQQSQFEKGIVPLVDQALDRLDQVLKELDLPRSQIQDAVFMGGHMHIPYIVNRFKVYLGIPIQSEFDSSEIALRGLVCEEFFKMPVKRRFLPFSIGFEDYFGNFVRVFPKFSKFPCTKSLRVMTFLDNQQQIQLPFYRGEIRKAKENSHLGNFIFSNLPGKMKGEVVIDMTFDLDARGRFRVHGREPQSGHVSKSQFQI